MNSSMQVLAGTGRRKARSLLQSVGEFGGGGRLEGGKAHPSTSDEKTERGRERVGKTKKRLDLLERKIGGKLILRGGGGKGEKKGGGAATDASFGCDGGIFRGEKAAPLHAVRETTMGAEVWGQHSNKITREFGVSFENYPEPSQ